MSDREEEQRNLRVTPICAAEVEWEGGKSVRKPFLHEETSEQTKEVGNSSSAPFLLHDALAAQPPPPDLASPK